MTFGRRTAALVAGLGALAIGAPGLGCGKSSSKKSGAARSASSGTKVAAVDFGFNPKVIRIKGGQSVTWTNNGQTQHTIKGPGFFTKQALGHGATFVHRFAKAGTYRYLCTLHPTLMKGTVVVS